MKNLLLVFFAVFTSVQVQATEFQYLSPKPSSTMVTPETNIILRNVLELNSATLSNDLIIVEGTKSGLHDGELILSDDDKTIVFNLYNAFANDETVNVRLRKGIKTISGVEVNELNFSFTTAPAGIVQYYYDIYTNEFISAESHLSKTQINNNVISNLPAPPITIDSVNNPSEGYIFMATWDRNTNPRLYGNFILILDNSGNIVDSVRVEGAPYDFQVQPNGLLSYALGDFASNVPLPGEELRHIILDSSLTEVDSYKMKNGYITDFHEFLMLPNGNVMMMSYHTILYDMSQIVEGGKPDASLVINIIQEQDKDKNVVFEWRNIDYIPITDSDLDLTASRINYGTLNAFKIDDDGNILASFRNHSEIMKINRATGELMWRMGSPRGEFTFVGEHEVNAPYYYARQHNITRLPNGNISLFDNGQFHIPPYSRAVEYSLDEVNKVATLVSEWRYPNGNIFCATAGNAQRLPNGGWFNGYGVPNPQFVKRNAVEVHPDGSIALELSLPGGVLAYRTYKYPWKELTTKPSFTHIEVVAGNTYSFNDESNITGVEIKFNTLNAADYNEVTVTRIPYGPAAPEFFGGLPTVYPVSIISKGLAINSHTSEVYIDLATYPEIKNPSTTSIYWREFPNSGLFLRRSTSYDSLNNQLTATVTGFGEIVFGSTGYDYDANIPILYEPANKIRVLPLESLALRWTGKGKYDKFQIQVSTDSLFSTTLIDSTLNTSFIVMKTLHNHTKYFWRVNSILGAERSDWSLTWNFETTDPFISMVLPNGGEEWTLGSAEVVRWETNISDTVIIDLLADQENVLSIGKTPGNIKAFSWQIPVDISPSSEYTIQIKSMIDTNLYVSSEQSFSIIDSSTRIANNANVLKKYILHQNYPNPFNPTTEISYQLPAISKVELSIYNLLGQKVATLVNKRQPAGIFKVEWDASIFASGLYFYRLETDNGFVQSRKLILLR